MADEVDNRRQGREIPRSYEPVAEDAILIRSEADMKGLLVSNHVWDSDAGAWVKMTQPLISLGGDVHVTMSDVEKAASESYWRDIRMEYSASVIQYRGRHTSLNAATSDTNWFVEKYTWDGNDCTRIQTQVTSWDSRASGWS
jgi:hypothetical protein